jgi:hypothetical protein
LKPHTTSNALAICCGDLAFNPSPIGTLDAIRGMRTDTYKMEQKKQKRLGIVTTTTALVASIAMQAHGASETPDV